MSTSSNPIARMWRTILPRRGSVARASDRFQAGVGVFVVLLALASLPVAAGFGSETYVRQHAQSAQQLGERTQVTATLLAGGSRRVGQVAAARGTLKGETSTIWVDRTGNPVDPPLSNAGAVIEAAGVGLGLWLGALALLAACYRLTVFFLDRFRFARWQQEWFQQQDRKTHS